MDSVVASEAIDPGSTPGICTTLRTAYTRLAVQASYSLRCMNRSDAELMQ